MVCAYGPGMLIIWKDTPGRQIYAVRAGVSIVDRRRSSSSFCRVVVIAFAITRALTTDSTTFDARMRCTGPTRSGARSSHLNVFSIPSHGDAVEILLARLQPSASPEALDFRVACSCGSNLPAP